MVEHHHQRPNPTTANCKELPKTNHLRLASHLHVSVQARLAELL